MVKNVFTAILVVSVIVTSYGAIAFFVMNDLPPNDAISGRLPSLYIMLGGIAGMLVGAVARNFKL